MSDQTAKFTAPPVPMDLETARDVLRAWMTANGDNHWQRLREAMSTLLARLDAQQQAFDADHQHWLSVQAHAHQRLDAAIAKVNEEIKDMLSVPLYGATSPQQVVEQRARLEWLRWIAQVLADANRAS